MIILAIATLSISLSRPAQRKASYAQKHVRCDVTQMFREQK